MSPALLSLIGLLVAIVLSIATRLNIGLVAIVLAWTIGGFRAGLGVEVIARTFPGNLFLTLVGVTLLFALAETNGTLARMADRAVRTTRGRGRLVPIMFFGVAMTISTIGPGAISTVALLIPFAMAIGREAKVPPFLTALMVANGANAGNLSPISTVGIIANAKMAEAGLGGSEAKVWFANFAAHLAVAIGAYFLLGGHRLAPHEAGSTARSGPLDRSQRLTLVVIAAWVAGLLFLKLPVGFSAFAAAIVLVVLRAAPEDVALKRLPWGVILMVCGVTVLIGVLEATGGMDLFTTMLSKIARPGTIDGAIAFITGGISTYSSTSGVVLPAFLPAVPSLVAKVGGGDPLAVALSINVGASIVDVSPLSTLGALCVAQVTDEVGAKRLFRQLLVWGLSMTIVGALFSQLFAGWLARW